MTAGVEEKFRTSGAHTDCRRLEAAARIVLRAGCVLNILSDVQLTDNQWRR